MKNSWGRKGKSDERIGMKAPKLWVEMCGKGT